MEGSPALKPSAFRHLSRWIVAAVVAAAAMVGVAPSAHAGCPGPSVAVLGYPGLAVTWNTNVIASLNSTGRFCGTIGDIDLNATSPSLSALAGYDAVLVYTDDAVGFTGPGGVGATCWPTTSTPDTASPSPLSDTRRPTPRLDG